MEMETQKKIEGAYGDRCHIVFWITDIVWLTFQFVAG